MILTALSRRLTGRDAEPLASTVPRGVVSGGLARLPGWSAGGGRQTNGRSADWSDRFQCYGVSEPQRPFVILFEQNGAEENDVGVLVGNCDGSDAAILAYSLSITVALSEDF